MPTLSQKPIKTHYFGVDKTTDLYINQTDGEGNCALNTIVQNMRELAEFEQLNRIFRTQVSFSVFKQSLMASLPTLKSKRLDNPFLTKYIELLENNIADLSLAQFSAFLKTVNNTNDLKELQQALAPALRRYMVKTFTPYFLQKTHFEHIKLALVKAQPSIIALAKKQPQLTSLQKFSNFLEKSLTKLSAERLNSFINTLSASEAHELSNQLHYAFMLTAYPGIAETDIPQKLDEISKQYTLQTTLFRKPIVAVDGAHIDGDELAALAAKLNIELHICQFEQTVKEEKSLVVADSIAPNPVETPEPLLKTYPFPLKHVKEPVQLYVRHTGSTLSGHWSHCVPATEEASVNFWRSIIEVPVKSADETLIVDRETRLKEIQHIVSNTVKSLLNELTDDVNMLASNVIDALASSQFQPTEQEDLVKILLNKLPEVYSKIAENMTESITNFNNEINAALSLTDNEIQEHFTSLYNESLKANSAYLDPHNGIDKIVEHLQTELDKAPKDSVTQKEYVPTSLEQALKSVPDNLKFPLGSYVHVSPGRSPRTLHARSDAASCAKDAEQIAKERSSFLKVGH